MAKAADSKVNDVSRKGMEVSSADEDRALVFAIQHGEITAFEPLFLKYRGRVSMCCARFVRDQIECADLTQEVFLKAWRAIGSYRHQYSFYTWLYRITVHCCVDHLRRQKRRPVLVSFVPLNGPSGIEEWENANESANPEKTLAEAQLRDRLNHAFSQLPEKLRKTLILKEISGYSYKEIAKILECSLGTVKSRAFKAKGLLKALLTPLMEEEENSFPLAS